MRIVECTINITWIENETNNVSILFRARHLKKKI